LVLRYLARQNERLTRQHKHLTNLGLHERFGDSMPKDAQKYDHNVMQNH